MVLAEFWFAFLPERGAVAGGLGVHPFFGQPGNYEVCFGYELPPSRPLSTDSEKMAWLGMVHLKRVQGCGDKINLINGIIQYRNWGGYLFIC